MWHGLGLTHRMLLKSSTVELPTNGCLSTRAIFWCPGGQPTHSLSSLQWLSPCNGNGHENAFLLPNLSTTAVNQGLTNSIYFFVQPRSQGLFLGLGAGRGKSPGNEVVICRKRSVPCVVGLCFSLVSPRPYFSPFFVHPRRAPSLGCLREKEGKRLLRCYF